MKRDKKKGKHMVETGKKMLERELTRTRKKELERGVIETEKTSKD